MVCVVWEEEDLGVGRRILMEELCVELGGIRGGSGPGK